MMLGKMPCAGCRLASVMAGGAPSKNGMASRPSFRVPATTGDTIDWWPWSYNVITVPRVVKVGATVVGCTVRAWYTSKKALGEDLPVAPDRDGLGVEHPQRGGSHVAEDLW